MSNQKTGRDYHDMSSVAHHHLSLSGDHYYHHGRIMDIP